MHAEDGWIDRERKRRADESTEEQDRVVVSPMFATFSFYKHLILWGRCRNRSRQAIKNICKDKYELVDAASDGNFDKVKDLIDEGAEVEATKPGGRTPLYWAVLKGHATTCVCLIEAGANVNIIMDEHRKTPLHLSAERGHTEACTALMEAGAEVDAKDLYQRTPLHWAAGNGHSEACTALVEAGAEVDAKDHMYRMTPLHCAAERGHTEACTALMEAGAEVDAKDLFQRTPLFHYLVAAGAEVDDDEEEDVFGTGGGDRLPAVLCLAGVARGSIMPSSQKSLFPDKFLSTSSSSVIGRTLGMERACSSNRTVLACMRRFVLLQ